MMKLTLVKTKELENKKFELYTIGKYEVCASTYGDGGKLVTVSINKFEHEFMPEICTRDNLFRGEIYGFEIQTTAYGSLNSDDIRKVIAGYNEALEVVEVLTKEFIK